ncbi:neocarzinostatin apoprotein domain-containing protein [Streptomyces tubbatahanensis]|uniref:Neocarzinostatin apoprotein domain-containing protein n=1 Tax=Streptomyces tubbatahanensis TaxID=2923272 RepID=A0ABY3Y4F8_9ACTN|nr:neocarzinostatin apoprotein domain-containing protein [Streptomyces tubbatahanensis]UNT01029.1 neocarzinostatin apoprotein domain-containing protein [Streptomyces tubbatahanensis]
MRNGTPNGAGRAALVAAVLACLALPSLTPATATPASATPASATSATATPASAQAQAQAASDKDKPEITLSRDEAGAGATVTVRGSGWRPDTLLTLLLCGQNAIGGTNACANAEGQAVTTDGSGRFSKKLPVAEPPEACPCVVRAATVTGEYAAADAAFEVAGHPVEPLPERRTGGRLAVLAARLEGEGGLLNWFGAPQERTLVLTVGNLGSDRARDPVFEVGTSHGVLAPEWERQQWRGTVDPGEKARIELPVELASGAHGAYTVAAKLDRRVLTEQPWEVGRPWGVTLFWLLLCVVVPAVVFRVGMLIVDRLRPRGPDDPAAAPTGPPRGRRRRRTGRVGGRARWPAAGPEPPPDAESSPEREPSADTGPPAGADAPTPATRARTTRRGSGTRLRDRLRAGAALRAGPEHAPRPARAEGRGRPWFVPDMAARSRPREERAPEPGESGEPGERRGGAG